MNKVELVRNVAAKAEMNQKEVDAVLTALSETITDELQAGGEVTIPGVAKFTVADVAERRGIIQMGDRKGEEYVTPAHRAPKAKIVKALKDALL